MSDNVFTIKSVTPTLIEVEVKDLQASMNFNIGSYIKIPVEDKEDDFLIGIIESYNITTKEEDNQTKIFLLNVQPIGTLYKDDKEIKFQRGFRNIPISSFGNIQILTSEELREMYNCNLKEKEKFAFSKLTQGDNVEVPVNGNRFFNKHIAVVGATGSGKSHTIAKILQNVTIKNYWNNSHFIVFDLHSEYQNAFQDANIIGSDKIIVPYWLFSMPELEAIFEISDEKTQFVKELFYDAVYQSKVKHFTGSKQEKENIDVSSKLYFNINEVLQYFADLNTEMVQASRGLKTGAYYGKLNNVIDKFERVLFNKRYNFIFNEKAKKIKFHEVLQLYLQSGRNKKTNVTIIDLGGQPFEIISITVAFISRIIFEFAYNYKRENANIAFPILLVYEEAHKYVPQSDLAKYRASKHSIERIAKEGRKYGVSLLIASQRPSEVSKTIFAQCNNFIAMRLTNPDDQNYVKNLLPDTLGGLTNNLPVLRTGEALLIGDAIEIPSIVQIDECENKPASNDIPYLEHWSQEWQNVDFDKIVKNWEK